MKHVIIIGHIHKGVNPGEGCGLPEAEAARLVKAGRAKYAPVPNAGPTPEHARSEPAMVKAPSVDPHEIESLHADLRKQLRKKDEAIEILKKGMAPLREALEADYAARVAVTDSAITELRDALAAEQGASAEARAEVLRLGNELMTKQRPDGRWLVDELGDTAVLDEKPIAPPANPAP